MHEGAGPDWLRRAFAAGGGVCCALAIAWAAYAAHALDPALRSRADSATLMLLAHGLALAVFAPRQRSRLELAALSGWAFGIVAFCGSLVLASVAATSTRFAPLGGGALILAWLLHAFAQLRH